MAYPDRIATTGANLNLTFVRLVALPAIPERQYGQDTPFFTSGSNSQRSLSPKSVHSNMPVLFPESYDSSIPNFTGRQVMGVAHADYAIREAGTGAAAGNSAFYENQAYIDRMAVGLNRAYTLSATPGYYNPTVDLTFQRQILGPMTGGVATVVSANAAESNSLALGTSPILVFSITHVVPTLASTTASPVALFPVYMQAIGAADAFDAIVIPASGAVLAKSLFKTDIATQPIQGAATTIRAHCQDATNHYFLRRTPYSFTICQETTFGSYTYTNHTPKFSDANLPVTLDALIDGTDPNYLFSAIYGTDQGFLISYRKLVAAVWVPKTILVDKAWTTVRNVISTAGDVTASTIIAQGAGAFDANAVSMMIEGNYAWLLGGTPVAPLIVEATLDGTGDATGDGTVDLSVRLRCWGYSLDDHDHYVLRLGPSATLDYDLKTGQWVENQSPARTNWRAHVGQNWVGMSTTTLNRGFGSDVVAGDDGSGVLWILDPKYGRDDRSTTSSDKFDRIVTSMIAANGRQSIPCNAVQLTCALGNPSQTAASITLETSDDLAKTWTNHGAQTIVAGVYDAVIEWRGLGQITAPGRVFRFTDDGATVRYGRAEIR